MGMIDDILTVCVNSAKANKLELVEGNKSFFTRAQLHVQLIQPFGSGKTSQTIDIPNSVQLTDYTLPGIAGTINPNKNEYVPGTIIECAGKVLVIDEAHNISPKARIGMLRLLEQQEYDRSLGFAIGKSYNRKRKYWYVRAKSGKNFFKIGSRFSCINACIYTQNNHSNDWAWNSRFCNIRMDLGIDDYYKVIEGVSRFDIKKTDDYLKPPVFTEWLSFTRKHKKIVENIHFFPSFFQKKGGFFTRNCLDLARICAYFSRGKSEVEDWDKYLEWVPILLYNIVTSSLNPIEYSVLDMLIKNNKTQQEIADILGVSQGEVSKINAKVKSLGLLKIIPLF